MEGMSGSDEEGEHDAYMERMKAEGKQRDDDDDDGGDDDDDSTGEVAAVSHGGGSCVSWRGQVCSTEGAALSHGRGHTVRVWSHLVSRDRI